MKVYLIRFDQGEYSDRSDRTVCAYTDEKLATEHCELANAWMRAKNMHMGNCRAPREERQYLMNPFDPDLYSVDYTGGDYSVLEIPLAGDATLAMMKAAHTDPGQWPIYADFVEETELVLEANKWRSPQAS